MGYPVAGAGYGPAGGYGCNNILWTGAGVILVLFILLVIVLRGGFW
ncbi:sporulation protein YjcZ [Paenibacillus spongiae]|uniref:Sporulation protein YjcZ n=1 Tax=Paenibacillus spongiae TaxID=2909671 RepID=A0ABY5S564_9BACL|nr:sporulation protein YjcZ [Paenibacillus spongiae]UVI27888.1 sporulation protein YjcZ [Paenibacillus spongiae]